MESITKSNAFIGHVENTFFKHIDEIFFGLVDKYILSCDEEEALAVCNAMQKMEAKRNITKETCDALTQEKSINPPLMQSLIDDRVEIQLSNKQKKQKAKNDKVARQNQTVSTLAKKDSDAFETSKSPPVPSQPSHPHQEIKQPEPATQPPYEEWKPHIYREGNPGRHLGRGHGRGRGRGRGQGRGRGRGGFHRGGRGRS